MAQFGDAIKKKALWSVVGVLTDFRVCRSSMRLISHPSLKHLLFFENGNDALQGILRLYDFSNHASIRKRVPELQT
jgi:hypothetical protein